MKKGIALFITLALIMIITVLVSKSLEISQESLGGIGTVKKINQVNFLVKNLDKVLKKIVEMTQVNENEDMIKYAFEMALPLEEKEIKLNLSFEPIDNKMDINLIRGSVNYKHIDTNSSKSSDTNGSSNADRNITKIFEYLFNKYEVVNYYAFVDLLDDTFDLDNEIKGSYDSEIILDDNNFENGGIYNYEQFNQILDRYALLTNDTNIYKIPWQKIIYFGDGKKKRPLYVNFMDDSLKEFFNIDLDEEAYASNEELKQALSLEDINNFNLKVYEKTDEKADGSFMVLCKIEYSFDTIAGQIKLLYDLGQKKVISIEEVL